jgi:hypothetical protein
MRFGACGSAGSSEKAYNGKELLFECSHPDRDKEQAGTGIERQQTFTASDCGRFDELEC